jgi:hypothetical protein
LFLHRRSISTRSLFFSVSSSLAMIPAFRAAAAARAAAPRLNTMAKVSRGRRKGAANGWGINAAYAWKYG